MTPNNNHHDLYIDGRWQASTSGQQISVISPSTEQVIGEVPDASEADVHAAVAAARRAFDRGPWRSYSTAQRGEILGRALDLLASDIDEIADLVTAQLGLPTAVSRAKTPGAVAAGRGIIAMANQRPLIEVRETRFGPTAVIKEPVGVVAAIAPWNSPFNMAIAKIIPALVAGNTVVYKPSPETPLDAYRIAQALADAGVPAGVFNLITGGVEAGRALVASPDIDKVSFTGSTAAGRDIARTAGGRFARLQLELGGKSAAIIVDDADPETVRSSIIAGTFANTGQVCSALTRILVPASSRATWSDVIIEAAESFTLGDPFAAATTMGPLVSAAQRNRVLGYLDIGRAEGARIASGGGVPDELPTGFFLSPTVFVDADNSMRISQEEIFGPVATILTYNTLDEAIALANDSSYGLHGAVFTVDTEAGLDVARRIRTGTFSINAYVHNMQAPFGGVKDSGLGREMAAEGLDAFYELKTVNVPSSSAELMSTWAAQTDVTTGAA